MITFLSRKLADFLCKKGVILNDEKEIYQYGYELLISDIFSFLILSIIGIFSKLIIETYVFYITFVLTRRFCGGYHADTYFKCHISTLIVYTLIMIISFLVSQFGIAFLNLILISFYFITALVYAPIENQNKPLETEDKIKFRKLSFMFGGIFAVICLLLMLVSDRLSLVVSLTLSASAMLMVIERYKNEEELK